LVSLGSIALSSFLLSVGIASAQPTRSDTSELTLAQALSTQEREELEQLRSERRVQQAQASWSHPKSSDNPVQCFAKHPGSTARIAIAALWLLRRAVIQEVATR